MFYPVRSNTSHAYSTVSIRDAVAVNERTNLHSYFISQLLVIWRSLPPYKCTEQSDGSQASQASQRCERLAWTQPPRYAERANCHHSSQLLMRRWPCCCCCCCCYFNAHNSCFRRNKKKQMTPHCSCRPSWILGYGTGLAFGPTSTKDLLAIPQDDAVSVIVILHYGCYFRSASSLLLLLLLIPEGSFVRSLPSSSSFSTVVSPSRCFGFFR